ncbi:MAG TPA: protein-disulfide reductase DsbD [Candidatus Krumholzibacteriaceae bacterium]|nr:protein-disulfide reductase DsbD [Candidatus Krumholzibacteriaceae bacterium]
MKDSLKRNILASVIILLILMPVSTPAQDLFTTPESLVEAEGHLSRDAFHPGSTGYLAIKVIIKDGWHINSYSPPDKYLIPTTVKVVMPDGIKAVKTLYPEAEKKSLEISDTPLPLYEGEVIFGIIFKIAGDIKPDEYKALATIEYQGCNNMTCLQPAESRAEIKLKVAPRGEQTGEINKAIFKAPPFARADIGQENITTDSISGYGASGGTREGKDETASREEESKESFGKMVESRGILLTLLIIFLGGLALNLTPCIYPLIPITISFFGGQAGGKVSKKLGLSLLYVLGISITYSVLGMLAATTGSILGSALQNPWVISFISLVLVSLALSMFGLWEIRMPVFLMKRTGEAKKGSYGALLMGLTVGIVAAPCIGPFVLGLLTYVGRIGNPLLGFIMFFTLAWGMGVPFIILGTASGSISRLPRSGEWLDWVKQIFGFILIIMAFYFARHILGRTITYTGYAITALSAGIFLGWIIKTDGGGKTFNIIRKTVALVWLVLAVFMIIKPGGAIFEADRESKIEWIEYTSAELEKAKRSGKPIMIDFSADWCIPCHELDDKTFSDPLVENLAEKMVTIRVDLTKSDPRSEKIKKEFKIKGVPTILFFNSEGEQITGLRVTGFIEPEELAGRIRQLK